MFGWLEASVTSGDLIPLALAILVFAAVLGIARAIEPLEVPKARFRAAAMGGRADTVQVSERRPWGRRVAARLRHWLSAVDLLKTKQVDHVVRSMAQAGWRSRDAIAVYLFAKLVLPMLIGLGLAVSLFVLWEGGPPTTVKLVFVLAGVLGASFLPDLVVCHAAGARRKAIELALPDAFDLLVICVEAGSSLDAAVDRIANEMQLSAPELADEMRTTALELRYLPERRQALDNLARRVDLPGVQALVSTLAQTERFGTPLAQALRVLASELRHSRMMKAEERASRLPALMTLPLVAFILPSLFIVLMGPAVLSLIRTFSSM